MPRINGLSASDVWIEDHEPPATEQEAVLPIGEVALVTAGQTVLVPPQTTGYWDPARVVTPTQWEYFQGNRTILPRSGSQMRHTAQDWTPHTVSPNDLRTEVLTHEEYTRRVAELQATAMQAYHGNPLSDRYSSGSSDWPVETKPRKKKIKKINYNPGTDTFVVYEGEKVTIFPETINAMGLAVGQDVDNNTLWQALAYNAAAMKIAMESTQQPVAPSVQAEFERLMNQLDPMVEKHVPNEVEKDEPDK